MNLRSNLSVVCAAVFTCMAVVNTSNAQDLDPRRYVNLPIKQNFVAVVYSYSEGDVNTSPSIPVEDLILKIDGPAVVYARTFALAGNAASVDASLPYICADGSGLLNGERRSRNICGWGDTRLRITYNFYGAPATDIREFRSQKKGIVLGASVQVSIPTGQYDDDKLLNIGANRWYIKPEIGISIPWRKWSFEFNAGVRFFTDNDEYLENLELSQDSLYNLQAHIIYDLTRRQWISLNSNYFFGGDTYQDDVPAATEQKNSRLGVTWAYSVTSRNTLKVLAHTGVITRIGNDSDTYSVAWTYRWD
jgi:hypothetical protein